MTWYKIIDNNIEIAVFVKPNAKQTAFAAITEQRLELRLKAKPQDGEANNELIEFFAKIFKIPKTKIILKSGLTSRGKILQLPLSEKLQQFIINPSLFIK